MTLTASILVAIIAGAIMAHGTISNNKSFQQEAYNFWLGLSNPAEAPSLIMESLGKAN
jgi:hypothetical protein